MTGFSYISPVQRAFEWVWDASLSASVLILIVSAIKFAFGRRLPARLCCALGLLVLLRLLLPAVPASSLSLFNLSRNFTAQSTPMDARLAAAVEAEQPVEPRALPPARPVHFAAVASRFWLAGLVVSLLLVWRRHHKFSRWVNGQPDCDDGGLKALLNECRSIMRVRREVGIVRAPQNMTPALFGWRKPRLLLATGLCEKLRPGELRMILLHELAHVKRADILLNWVALIARSLHWFNPLVWLALRRLRTDRELVCDTMVLERVGADERRTYGETLIRLAEEVSGAGTCPALAPVVSHKQETKRRVTMIAKFKPAGRLAALASAVLVVILCAFTFTRAADKTASPKKDSSAMSDPYFVQTEHQRSERSRSLKKKLEELEQRINDRQRDLDELRRELFRSGAAAPGQEEGMIGVEIVRRLESARIEAEANYKGQSELLKQLRELKTQGDQKLRRAMLTANYDPQLGKLLEDLWAAEATLARLKETQGPNHPEFMSVSAMQADLDRKVNERIEGILSGLDTKAAAARAQIDSLSEAIGEARTKDAEANERYRPYFRAKRDLENLERVREALYLKILGLDYGVDAEKATAGGP